MIKIPGTLGAMQKAVNSEAQCHSELPGVSLLLNMGS